ncbi:MAG: response regulator [Phycisphaerae bacterium]|nr:response regulator [Phycisphaerae bacterium]
MANQKILIVDDDPDITYTMQMILESHGYQVDSAVNSTTAKSRMEQEKPDLIILDVMMDTMHEGFDFDRELKHHPEYKDIPVLMLTAVKERFGLDFKPEAGNQEWLPVEEFLDKPVKPTVLLEKVEKLLGN